MPATILPFKKPPAKDPSVPKAWGFFREGAWVTTLRSAGWPEGMRPYMLRHTGGMTMTEAGADLADIQQHLGHKRIETMRRHYVPVLGSRLQRVSELLEGRFGWSDGITRGALPKRKSAELRGYSDVRPRVPLSPKSPKPRKIAR